jgi:hypothetical protein
MTNDDPAEMAASPHERRQNPVSQRVADSPRLQRLRVVLATLEQRAHFVSEEIAKEMERLGVKYPLP